MKMPPSETILMQNIQRSATAIGKLNGDGPAKGSRDRDQAEALLLLCVMLQADIASALEQDPEARETIMVSRPGCSEPHDMTLAQCQEWCREVKMQASECVYRFRIQQALLQANVWVSDLQEPGSLNEEQATVASEAGCILLQVLQDALASGVSETITVELNEAPVSLAQVRNLGQYVAAAGKPRNEQLEAD